IRLEEGAPALIVSPDRRGALAEAQIGDRLQRHRAARGGWNRKILEGGQIAPRAVDQAHPDRDLPVRERELRPVLRQIAERRDADGLADALHAHAELRGDLEPRMHQDLRPGKVADY